MGGIAANLTNLNSAEVESLSFELSQQVHDANPIEYQLALKPQGVDFVFESEQLMQDRNDPKGPFLNITSKFGNVKYYDPKQRNLVSPDWEYDGKHSALSQVPKMFDEPEAFRKDLASSTHYHVLDVSPKAPVRLPQPMRNALLPGKDGEDLVSCLYTIRETDPECFV
jgi:predicted ATPase